MGKKKLVNPEFHGNVFDESDFAVDSFDSSSMEGPMAHAVGIMMQASSHQMSIALELTKLIVEKDPVQKDREEHVFSVFKKATKVAAENFALKDLLEQFEQ